jgi:hypothetical protein
MRRIALLLSLVACDAEPTVRPIVDAPDPAHDAYPFDLIDSLELAVARAGAGGNLASVTVPRGEVPVLSSVPFGDDLVVHLAGTRAGIEIAYGRTCAFSVDDGAAPPAPHLFFTRTVKWTPGPAPALPGRRGAFAYTTPDGAAILVGGDAGEDPVERFDPRVNAFAAAGTSAPRRFSVVAPLLDGRALRIGGGEPEAPSAFFELLSPQTAAVERVDDERLRLIDHAAATLVDGSVVVIGGRTPGAGGALETTGATFSLRLGAAGTPDPPRLLQAQLAVPRHNHTLTLMGDELGAAVLVVGGLDAAGAPVAAAEIYEPLREGYAGFHPTMLRPRSRHQAVRMPDGSILIVGGVDASGAPVDGAELYLPRIGQFVPASTRPMPALAGLTDMTLTPLPDGRVLLAGGMRDGAPVATTYIARLDPLNGSVDFSQTDSLAVPRAAHTAARLCDGTILLVGGATTGPGSERYNPPAAGRR